MSDDVIIRAENIGKRYVLNHQTRGAAGQYHKLSDTLVHAAKAPLRLFQKEKVESGKQKGTEDFWALKDINFEIKRGEVVGIIGRNGAGKSTLLKILSRITEPTTGRITLRGRVASLLEVGTGFHPELTGRENIYLNGAILGMRRDEIRAKFDEIVAFAEIERFLDTPVKRYSSGMYVRLAFAVAAHLEPEILIVDEVLAVGDAQFQAKCLGKMQDVAKGGRTVLFVSHQVGVVSRLCGRVLLMNQGSITNDGATSDVLTEYLASGDLNDEWWQRTTPPSSRPFIQRMQTQRNGKFSGEFGYDEEITLVVVIETRGDVANIRLGVTIQDHQSNFISTAVVTLNQFQPDGSVVIATLIVPSKILAPNRYSFRAALFEGRLDSLDVIESACSVRIVDTGTPMAAFEGINYGVVILPFRWM